MNQYDPIPGHMMNAMKYYVATGDVTSGFLIAVIENDLKSAVNNADDYNVRIIDLYVKWFYNQAPMACWGSPAARANWNGVNA